MARKNAEFVTNRSFSVISGWGRPDKTGSAKTDGTFKRTRRSIARAFVILYVTFPNHPSFKSFQAAAGWVFLQRTFRNSQRRAKPPDMPSASEKDTRTPLLAVPKRRRRRSFFTRLRSVREEKILVEIFSKRIAIHLFPKLNINVTCISLYD